MLGGIGYAIGQFFSSRRKGISDSLRTALDEVAAEKLARERLAVLAQEKATDLATAKAEVVTLRNALSSGAKAAPEIIKAINDSMQLVMKVVREEQEKTRAAIATLKETR